jgi:heat shock protein HslJ
MKINILSAKNSLRNFPLAIFAALTISSCSTTTVSKNKLGSSQVNITNTQWTLADHVKGKKPTLVIESGKISGNGGCNNYFAELMLDPTVGNFSTTNIGSTRKACDNMSEETLFFSTLGAATKYVVTGSTLELYKDNLLLLKFSKL